MVESAKRLLKGTFRFTEVVVKLFIPISAVIILILRLVRPESIKEVTSELILAIVAGLAISEGLSRFCTLEDIKKKVEKLHDYDIPNQKLLQTAHNAGIVAISPRFTGDWLSDIVDSISKCKANLDISGVALPSILKEPKLKNAILQYAKKNEIRILLLDPMCPEAERRSNIERPHQTTISDIKSTVDWLKEKIAENYKIRIHLYSLPPMLALFLTEHHVFVEPYHFGRPKDITTCIGGYVPLLKIKNKNTEEAEKNPYLFFKEHYQYLWNDSKGGRVNLDISTTSFDPMSHITLCNNNNFDISMLKWTLAAQGVTPVFEFPGDLKWIMGESLTISFSKDNSVSNSFFWDIKCLKISDILTITTAEGITAIQWAPYLI